MTYNLCYFLGNKAFVVDFLETGVTLLCVFCGQPGKNCPGRINIPHQNSDVPIIQICLECVWLSVNNTTFSDMLIYSDNAEILEV